MVHTIYQERKFTAVNIKTAIVRMQFYSRNGWENIGVPHKLNNKWQQKLRRPLISMML